MENKNPQIEDGYVKIANQLIEAMARVDFSPHQMRILWVIWRKTYGWNKKEDWVSYSQFEAFTGIDRKNIPRIISSLLDQRIITRRKTGKKYRGQDIYYYSFNKKYWEWLENGVVVDSLLITKPTVLTGEPTVCADEDSDCSQHRGQQNTYKRHYNKRKDKNFINYNKRQQKRYSVNPTSVGEVFRTDEYYKNLNNKSKQ